MKDIRSRRSVGGTCDRPHAVRISRPSAGPRFARVALVGVLAASMIAGCSSTGSSSNGVPAGSASTERQAFLDFSAHVAASGATLKPLLTAVLQDGVNGDVASLRTHAGQLRAWSREEAAWLDANVALGCFANLFVIWDVVQSDVDQAAQFALAGQYDQMQAEMAKAAESVSEIASRLDSVTC